MNPNDTTVSRLFVVVVKDVSSKMKYAEKMTSTEPLLNAPKVSRACEISNSELSLNSSKVC